MRRGICVLVSLALCMLLGAAQAEEDGAYVRITSSNTANVRASDNADSARVGRVQPGETYPYLGTTASGWYQIQLADGKTGYVSAKLAEVVGGENGAAAFATAQPTQETENTESAQPLGNLMNNGLKGVKDGARLVAQENYPLTSDNVFTTDTKGVVIDGAGYRLKLGRQSNSFSLSIPHDLTLENFGIDGVRLYGGTLTLRDCQVVDEAALRTEIFDKPRDSHLILEDAEIRIKGKEQSNRFLLAPDGGHSASLTLNEGSLIEAKMEVSAYEGSRVDIVNDGQMDVGESRFSIWEGSELTYSGNGSVTGDQLSIDLWEGATASVDGSLGVEKLYFRLNEGAALSVGADLAVKDLGVVVAEGATAELSGSIQTDGTLVEVGKDSRVSVKGDLGYLQIYDRDGAGSVNVDGNTRYISLHMDAANAAQWTVHLEGGLRQQFDISITDESLDRELNADEVLSYLEETFPGLDYSGLRWLGKIGEPVLGAVYLNGQFINLAPLPGERGPGMLGQELSFDEVIEEYARIMREGGALDDVDDDPGSFVTIYEGSACAEGLKTDSLSVDGPWDGAVLAGPVGGLLDLFWEVVTPGDAFKVQVVRASDDAVVFEDAQQWDKPGYYGVTIETDPWAEFETEYLYRLVCGDQVAQARFMLIEEM